MATISKTGIGTGGIVQAEHLTRIIDALNESGSAEIIATGSFSGSFTGDGSGLISVISSSFATTSSYALNTDTNPGIFSLTGSVQSTTNDIVITGSLTVDPTEIISATTRTIKETVTIDNTTAIVGSHPSSSNIYPGTRAFIDLSQSSTNQIFYELGAASEYQIGSQYEFIVIARSGSLNALRIDTQERLRARIHGADGTTQYAAGGFTSVYTGLDNAAVGDRITITKINQGALPVWLVEAFVSGAAGYSVV